MKKVLLRHLQQFGILLTTFGIASILERWMGLLELLQTAPRSVAIVLTLTGLLLAVFAQLQEKKQQDKTEPIIPEVAK